MMKILPLKTFLKLNLIKLFQLTNFNDIQSIAVTAKI